MSLLVDVVVAVAVGLVPLLLGAAFVRHGLRQRRETAAFAARASRATGLVVGLAERRTEDDEVASWLFHPVLRFPGPDGREVEVESAVGSTPPPARAGQTVEVLYDPADVATARLAAPAGLQHLPDLLVAVGVGIGVAGLLGLLLLRL